MGEKSANSKSSDIAAFGSYDDIIQCNYENNYENNLLTDVFASWFFLRTCTRGQQQKSSPPHTDTNLGNSKLKVFLRDVLPSLPQRVHTYHRGKPRVRLITGDNHPIEVKTNQLLCRYLGLQRPNIGPSSPQVREG